MNVTILAVSKRLNGVCIAGIGNDRWIRPTKKEELMLDDIRLENGYVSVGNTYEFHFSGRNPQQCQSENYLMEGSILKKSTLSEDERRRLFTSLCENTFTTAEALKARNRSLVMLGPIRIDSVYIHKEEKMKPPEIKFSVNGVEVKGIKDKPMQCTDLKFWSFARSLLGQRESLTLDGTEVKKQLRYENMFIIIGLTKLYHGINWPMIISIHTIPDYRQEIDYGLL